MTDDVRGRSKIEAYLKYVEIVEDFSGTFEGHHPNPKNKKRCKELMIQDPTTGEWVLRFHLHT